MLILGSKSPRRKEILDLYNIPFKVYIKDINEDVNESDPIKYAMKTAEKKGKSISCDFPSELVLCADTIVTIDNVILGKPKNKNEAYEMINMLQGRDHHVITGVYLGVKDNYKLFYETTTVSVKELSLAEIEDYINTSEPYDKAGAYAIQGLFGKYVTIKEGSYYNVMGLPIERVIVELSKGVKL